MRGHGCVTYEARFDTRREELRTHFMIAAIWREDESGVRIVELARDGEHLGVVQRVRVEHDPGGVARELSACESIDLVNLNLARHRLRIPGLREGSREEARSQAVNSSRICFPK